MRLLIEKLGVIKMRTLETFHGIKPELGTLGRFLKNIRDGTRSLIFVLGVLCLGEESAFAVKVAVEGGDGDYRSALEASCHVSLKDRLESSVRIVRA